MSEYVVFLDGGDPIPQDLARRWQREASQRGLAWKLQVAYVMMKADAYRRAQEDKT